MTQITSQFLRQSRQACDLSIRPQLSRGSEPTRVCGPGCARLTKFFQKFAGVRLSCGQWAARVGSGGGSSVSRRHPLLQLFKPVQDDVDLRHFRIRTILGGLRTASRKAGRYRDTQRPSKYLRIHAVSCPLTDSQSIT